MSSRNTTTDTAFTLRWTVKTLEQLSGDTTQILAQLNQFAWMPAVVGCFRRRWRRDLGIRHAQAYAGA